MGAPRGRDFLKRQSDRELKRRLQQLSESTAYRLNEQVCPFCRANGTGTVRLELNHDDYLECAQCGLVAQLVYETKAVNALNILSWNGAGNLKAAPAKLDHLFEDLLVIHTYPGGTIDAFNSSDDLVAFREET